MDMPDADLISLNSVDGSLNLQQNEMHDERINMCILRIGS